MLANEFHGLSLECSPNDIVPSGPGYDALPAEYKTCTLPGSTPGSLTVLGDNYLGLTYDFHFEHIGRNLAVLAAQALAFLIIGVIATDFLSFAEGGRRRIWTRTRATIRRFGRRSKAAGNPSEEERLIAEQDGDAGAWGQDEDLEAQEPYTDEDGTSVAGTPAHGTDDETEIGTPSAGKLEGSVLAVRLSPFYRRADRSLIFRAPFSTVEQCIVMGRHRARDSSVAGPRLRPHHAWSRLCAAWSQRSRQINLCVPRHAESAIW